MVSTIPQRAFAVEDLLDLAVEASQPTRTQHEQAVQSYAHVGKWVCDPLGSLGLYRPRYKPQGSFVYGTVVRPLWQHEFDLDSLAQLEIDPYRVSSDIAYELVSRRIAEHGDLSKRMELHERCIRLIYQGDFHHDVTPACDNPLSVSGKLVRAKKSERANDSAWASWKANDHAGYARWFEQRSALLIESRAFESVDPEPAYVPASEKTPLRKLVQLVKMRRNRFYKPLDVPASILLTTMAAECYRSQSFTLEANIEVVAAMSGWAEREGDALRVIHPTLPDEDFARPMSVAQKARLREFLRTYLAELIAMSEHRGVQRITESMKSMFDASATDAALRRLADTVQSARSNDSLHVGRVAAPLVIVTSKAAAAHVMPHPNPAHDFHGGHLGG